MDTLSKLKDAGLQGAKLESSWLRDMGREAEVGEVRFIPRQA